MKAILFLIIIILTAVLLMLIFETEAFSQTSPLTFIVSRDSSKADAPNAFIYPRVGMGTGTVYSAYDWTYKNIKIPAYIVLAGNQPLISAKFNLNWDSSKIDVSAVEGDLFTSQIFKTRALSQSCMEVNISSLTGNVTPVTGKTLVKIMIAVKKVGVDTIGISNCILRYYNSGLDIQENISATISNGIVKFYPGDFAAARLIQNRGDGDVNYQDVAVFGQHYNGTLGADTLYKVKYDIYPTENYLDYYSLPVGDGTINFFDLIIFSLGYNYEANGNLLIKNNTGFNTKEITFSLGKPVSSGNGNYNIPLTASGDVRDLRGYSVKILFNEKEFEYISFADKKDIPSDKIAAFTKTSGNIVQIDFAVLGANTSVINAQGLLSEISFKKKNGENIKAADFAIIEAIAMNSFREEFKIKIQN